MSNDTLAIMRIKSLLAVLLLCVAIVAAGCFAVMYPLYYPVSSYSGPGTMVKTGVFYSFTLHLPSVDIISNNTHRWDVGRLPRQKAWMYLVLDDTNQHIAKDNIVVSIKLLDKYGNCFAHRYGTVSNGKGASGYQLDGSKEYIVELSIVSANISGETVKGHVVLWSQY
jgi:hypothetical protein